MTALTQVLQVARSCLPGGKGRRINPIPGEGILDVLFTAFKAIKARGEDDVGYNAALLGRITGNSVEFLNRHLGRSQGHVLGHAAQPDKAIKIKNRLNRAFAVGVFIADDQGTTKILQGTGQNF